MLYKIHSQCIVYVHASQVTVSLISLNLSNNFSVQVYYGSGLHFNEIRARRKENNCDIVVTDCV